MAIASQLKSGYTIAVIMLVRFALGFGIVVSKVQQALSATTTKNTILQNTIHFLFIIPYAGGTFLLLTITAWVGSSYII